MKSKVAVFVVVMGMVIASACASIPAKQKAVTALQGAEVGLGAAQDAERQLCDPVKASVPGSVITECPSTVAASLGLTTVRHQAFAAALARAFTAQSKAVPALQAWRSGDPAPANIDEALTAANDALKVAQYLATGNARVADIIANLQDYVKRAAAAAVVIKGGK